MNDTSADKQGPQAVSAEGRNTGLDVLRSCAIGMVFITHAFVLFGPLPRSLVLLSHTFGNGVELFFSLSGFLIGGMLIRAVGTRGEYSRESLFTFYKRRWYKTIPLYYLGVILNYAAGYFITGNYHDFSWRFLLFVQNMAQADFRFFPVSYSLSIGEWFYLLFPFVLFAAGKLAGKKCDPVILVSAVAVGFILMFTIVRYRFFFAAGFHWDAVFRKSVVCRLDCNMYGVLMAVLLHWKASFFDRFRWHMFIVGCLLFVLFMYVYIGHYESSMNYVFYFTGIPAAFALMIPLAYSLQISNSLLRKFFTRLSLLAFSLYMIHLSPVLELVMHYMQISSPADAWQAFFVYTLVSVTAAWILYRFFEKPVTDLRDK